MRSSKDLQKTSPNQQRLILMVPLLKSAGVVNDTASTNATHVGARVPQNRSCFQDLPPTSTYIFEDRWPTKSNPRYPCRCLSNTANSISHAAIGAAHAYYRLSSPIKDKLTAPWITDLIEYRISNARATALNDIDAAVGVVIYTKHDTSAELSSHVQPWAVASIHRATDRAAKDVLKEIDDREGTSGQGCSQEKPPFSFRAPGRMFSNPFMKHFPCLCKDANANKVANLVLEDYMRNTPDGSKMDLAMYQSVKNRLNVTVAKATVHALEEIAHPGDEKYRCSAYGRPPHVLKWMNTMVKAICEKAIAREVDIIRLEIAKSKAREHVTIRSNGSLPDVSVGAVSNLTIGSRPGLSTSSVALPTAPKRGISKIAYPEYLTLFVATETLASLKRFFPLINRVITDPWVHDHLKLALAEAKDCALGVIARFEQIIDEAQIIDSGKHLHKHGHPWMASFVKQAIRNAANRAVEKFRMQTELAGTPQARMYENKQLMSAKTPERMAAQGLMKMAEEICGQSSTFGEEIDQEERAVNNK